MHLAILPVQTWADKRDFYNFAWQVYQNDPNWVPHLWPQRRSYLERKAAFFNYGEGEFWLARRGREIVGTLGTAIDHSRNRNMGWNAAVFGFFEVLPDGYEVAAALWDHACKWACERGMRELQGPYSFSTADDPGFLVQGFECAPTIMMGHTPPYYAEFAQHYGFEVLQESVAYRIDLAGIHFDIHNAPAVVHRIADRVLRRYGNGVIRHACLAEWEQEIKRLHPLYNRSLAVLPEFSPIEEVEFRAQAMALKPILDPDLVLIAEMDDKAVGFALGLPNIMEALRYANGLRYPWDYVRLALAQRRITGVSFKILAVDPDYWGYGLEALLFLEFGKAAIKKGYTWIDGSLTNQHNPQTNKLATRMGGYVYRRYREYRLPL
jgi:GNAT superfamily N-acetyltransferase